MYPYDIDPRSYINSALALQTPTGAGMPRMTPASHSYYGPTHQALADTLAAALARQASNAGLFAPPTTPGVSGGLMAPAGTTPSASFFRMPSDFSKPVYIPPVSTPAAPSTGVSNTAQTSSGGGHNGPSQPIYSSDFTRSNGPVGTQYGFTGPYDNGGGPGNSFVDGTFFGGIGNFFNSLFNPAPPPTSIDALGSDTKTTAEAPAPTYRLSSNDLMGGLGPQASITGTPLAPPSNDMMPGIGAQPSITGTDIGTPMQEPSQTLNGLLTGNYEPVTGYSNNFSRLTSADLTPAPNADVSQAVTAPNANASQAVTAPNADVSQAVTAGVAPAALSTPTPYRLSTTDLSQPTFTGTQFSSQPGDVMPAIAPNSSIIGTPLPDLSISANAGSLLGNPSQTLNAVSPATETAPAIAPDSSIIGTPLPDLSVDPNSLPWNGGLLSPTPAAPSTPQVIQVGEPTTIQNKIQDQLPTAPEDLQAQAEAVAQANSAATRQQAEQAAAQEAANLANRQVVQST